MFQNYFLNNRSFVGRNAMKTKPILCRIVLGGLVLFCLSDSVAQTDSTLYRENSYYRKTKRGLQFQLVVEPVMVSPSQPFYDGLNSAFGSNFCLRLTQVTSDGRTSGFLFGVSYQQVNLGFQTDSGSISTSVTSFEFGRALPLNKGRSYFYFLLGLSSLNHNGGSPSGSSSVLSYEEGSRLGIRGKAGFNAALNNKFGLEFSFGFDSMYKKVTFPALNNYSETKLAGVLLTYGAGVSYTF